MSPFELLEPATLAEAVALLEDEDTRAFSGGTALMLMMKAGVLRPKRLVSLRRLGLDRIAGWFGPDAIAAWPGHVNIAAWR